MRGLAHDNRQTWEAASGEEALQVLKEREIDLVITDLVMPGMDGISLVRNIRNTDPTMKIVIITAYGSAESTEEAEALGVASYFAKPFDLADLKATADDLLFDGLHCGESVCRAAPRVYCYLCSAGGRTLGTLISLSRTVYRYFKPGDAMLVAARTKAIVSGICFGFREAVCSLKKRGHQ